MRRTLLLLLLALAALPGASLAAFLVQGDSEISDKVFFVSPQSLLPNFADSLLPFQVCEAGRPSYCKSKAIPVLDLQPWPTAPNEQTSGPPDYWGIKQSILACYGQGFTATQVPCFLEEGTWWWAVNNTVAPVVLTNVTSFNDLVDNGPFESAYREGDASVRYWTGVSVHGGDARACTADGVRWNSANAINEPQMSGFVQGGMTGTGFGNATSAERVNWVAEGTVPCNTQLPLLCLCRTSMPILKQAQLRANGIIEFEFDIETNGLRLESFPCSELFTVTTLSGTPVSQEVETGYCRFIDDFILVATLPRTSNFSPEVHKIKFIGAPETGAFSIPNRERTMIHKIRNYLSDVHAVAPSLVTVQWPTFADCYSPPITIVVPKLYAQCSTNLVLRYQVAAENDGGRTLHSGKVISNPCIDATWDVLADGCARWLSLTELETGVIQVNTTELQGSQMPTMFGFSVELYNWMPENFTPCGAAQVSESAVVEITSEPYATVILPDVASITRGQGLSIMPDITLDPVCASFFGSNLEMSYSWTVTSEGTYYYYNSTNLALELPPYSLSTPWEEEDGACTSRCERQYDATLVVTIETPQGYLPVFEGTVSIQVSPETPFTYVSAYQSPNGTIVVDASKSCDPNTATTSCIPGYGLIHDSSEIDRGITFFPAKCLVFSTDSYVDCAANNFVDESFNVSNVQCDLVHGICAFPPLKPGRYIFSIPMALLSGEEQDRGSDCIYTESPLDWCPELVLELFENCVRPQIRVATIPEKLNVVPNQPVILKNVISYNGEETLGGIQWEIYDSVLERYVSLGPNTPNYIIDSSKFLEVPNRPSLVLPPNILMENGYYKFRLTAAGLGESCGNSADASMELKILVNDRPNGGICSVSPSSGKSFLTTFTLSTSGWMDSDLPLSFAFSLASADAGSVASTISDFSASSVLNTVLDGRFGNTSYVIASAKDVFGAVSTVRSSLITLSPIIASGDPLSNLVSPEDVESQLVGSSINEKLRAFAALGFAAHDTKFVPGLNQTYLATWRNSVSRAALSIVRDSRGSPFGRSVEQTQLQVAALLGGLRADANLDESTLEETSELASNLINDMMTLSSNVMYNGVASQIIPESFASSLLDIIAELSMGIKAGSAGDGVRRRLFSRSNRDLQSNNNGYNRAAVNIRSTLQSLIHVLMEGYVPGAPPQQFDGVQISIKVIRENRGMVGGSSLPSLTVGDVSVLLPQSVLDDQFLGNNPHTPPRVVDVVLARFRFNLRELANSNNRPPGFDPANITIDGVIADDFVVQEMTSLLFLSSEDPMVSIDPSGLQEPITLTLPLSPEHNLGDSTDLELACGAWDEGFSGWSAVGCRVATYSSSSLTCVCTHASDYAAWKAFTSKLGGGPVGIIATISVVVVGIIVPGVLALYLVLMLWAWRRDARDAEGVQVGALLLLTKNKLRLRAKQRKFFQLLRENARDPQPLTVDPAREAELRKARDAELGQLQVRSWYERLFPAFLARWVRALIFDHSLFGVFTRFDPYYTRTQRVTVVVAVICGNFFVASFMFDLKTAENITFGFMLGVVFLSAIIVALPVKMILRVLFRQTEAITGSTMDRVIQIFRVTQMHHDLVPFYASKAEQADIEMIIAFSTYYIAKAKYQNAVSTHRRAIWEKWVRKSRLLSCLPACLTEFCCCLTTRSDEVEPSEDNTSTLKESDLVEQKAKAYAAYKEASDNLRAKSIAAKEEWDKVPRRRNHRVETLRKQQNAVMKFAALLYDEVEPGAPRERVKIFGHRFIIFAWALVIVYLVACLAFTSYWMLAYTSEKPEETVEANEVIASWLLASALGVIVGLFISEPLIQFLRHALVPWCLIRYGNGIISSRQRFYSEDDQSISEDGADNSGKAIVAQEPAGDMGNVQTKAEFGDEYMKKRKKSNKQPIGTVILDFAAEVTEALA